VRIASAITQAPEGEGKILPIDYLSHPSLSNPFRLDKKIEGTHLSLPKSFILIEFFYHFSFLKTIPNSRIFKGVIPAKAGIQVFPVGFWIPVFTGMTKRRLFSKG